VNAALPISELNGVIGSNLPHEGWNTVGGLVFGLAGRIPAEGEGVDLDGYHLVVEKLQGRRIIAVVMEKAPEPETPEANAEE